MTKIKASGSFKMYKDFQDVIKDIIGDQLNMNRVVRGMNLTYNPGSQTLSITSGKAVVEGDSDVRSIFLDDQEVDVPVGENNLYLKTSNDVELIFSNEEPSDSLLLGTVDVLNETVKEVNRREQILFDGSSVSVEYDTELESLVVVK
jgi:hypothetical protein